MVGDGSGVKVGRGGFVGSKNLSYVIFLLILAVVPLFIKNPFMLTILLTAFFYAFLALTWNLVGGYAGQMSFAHALFLGVGGYTSTMFFIKLNLSPWVGMFIGAVFATGVAFLVGLLSFGYKIKGFYFALITLAFSEIFRHIARSIDFIGGTRGIMLPLNLSWAGFQFRARVPYYYIALVMMGVAILVTYFVMRSKMGYSLLAIREDEECAESSGVDTKRYKNIVFCLSAFLTALGGTFLVQLYFFIDPDTIFSLDIVINMVLMVMIGGAGTIWGPIIGAFFFTFLGEGMRFIPIGSQQLAALTRMFYAGVLVLVVLFLPAGIMELRGRLFGRGERKVVERASVGV